MIDKDACYLTVADEGSTVSVHCGWCADPEAKVTGKFTFRPGLGGETVEVADKRVGIGMAHAMHKAGKIKTRHLCLCRHLGGHNVRIDKRYL